MEENRTVRLAEIPFGGNDGHAWNRLHGEREEICETLLKELNAKRTVILQARLRKLDDALDRLMSGAYGNCSKCGRSIEDTRLDLDPALALCLNCWAEKPTPAAQDYGYDSTDTNELLLESLEPFDTILLRTNNSAYRILLLDPKTGRALIEGGDYLVQPNEALLRGSTALGSEFKSGTISVGSRLELCVNERILLTSPINSVQVKHNSAAESVPEISAALH